METTIFLSKLVGPVLLLRAASILLDRKHFDAMIENLEDELKTVSFSMVPVAMMMTAIAVLQIHTDTSSLAAILFHIIAWGMLLKTGLLILVPSMLAKKAQMVRQMGFINVVWVMCLIVGLYLTWFGYFQ